MMKVQLANDFKIVHRTKVLFKHGIIMSTRTPFNACTCKGTLCTCMEAAPIVMSVHLDRKYGKRKFVRVMAHFTGSYSFARRLWANAELHVVRP